MLSSSDASYCSYFILLIWKLYYYSFNHDDVGCTGIYIKTISMAPSIQNFWNYVQLFTLRKSHLFSRFVVSFVNMNQSLQKTMKNICNVLGTVKKLHHLGTRERGVSEKIILDYMGGGRGLSKYDGCRVGISDNPRDPGSCKISRSCVKKICEVFIRDQQQ